MPLTPQHARHGAAYQVMFERVCPDNCFTAERIGEVRAIAAAAARWAEQQPADVRAAYSGDPAATSAELRGGAIAEVVKRAEACLENHVRYQQLMEARRALPEPPI